MCIELGGRTTLIERNRDGVGRVEHLFLLGGFPEDDMVVGVESKPSRFLPKPLISLQTVAFHLLTLF